MEKLLLWTNCQTSGEKTIINYKEGSGNRNKDKGGGNIRKTQFPFFRSMSVSHNRKHSPAFIKCSQKSAQQTYGIIQVKPGTAQGSKSMKQKDLHGLASSVGISLNNLQESQSRCPRFKIRDSRSEIWALLFSVRGMTYLWFNHRDLRFSWEINVHCQIQSHYFVYFCVIWTSVVHVGFFSPVQMQEEMKENFFSFSDEEQSQEAKETVTAKLMLKKQVNNFIPCYIVSLCYQQKGFVPCWANKKNVLPVVAKFCSTSCEGKGLWRRICSTHHSQEWEEGGAEERDTQGKKEGPHWGETVLERNWNTSETIIWC